VALTQTGPAWLFSARQIARNDLKRAAAAADVVILDLERRRLRAKDRGGRRRHRTDRDAVCTRTAPSCASTPSSDRRPTSSTSEALQAHHLHDRDAGEKPKTPQQVRDPLAPLDVVVLIETSAGRFGGQ